MNLSPANEQPRYYADWHRDHPLFDGGGVAILMYHKISPPTPGTAWPDLFAPAALLGRQLTDLLDAGWRSLPYDRARSAAGGGENGFCVTFDDAFQSVYEHALPILAACRVRAMLFVVAGQIGGTDAWDRAIGEEPLALMDEGRIREWLAAGHGIGAHTMSHPRLTQLPRARARAEIFDSRAALEDRFGVAVRHFCYPYGDHDDAVRALVAEAGFDDACTVTSAGPALNLPGADPFQLRRLWARQPEGQTAAAAHPA